jgi:guanine deaminase
MASPATIYLQPGQFLIPGFVDTHNHAPQYLQRGLGQGMHILDWLDRITFPQEARFSDPEHARSVYPRLVRSMLRQGITTASYYASIHAQATKILAESCLQAGQRALIGKCNMDNPSTCPDIYRESSTAESLQATEDCIHHIRSLDPKGTLIRPVLTPRFAISCTHDLLIGLGSIATREPLIPIQTHFNEAQQEIDATLSLFPEFKNEVDLYSSFNLLTPRTILAHCTIMTPEQTAKLAALGCGVAHCPTANMTVGGGFMAAPIRDFLSHGIKVGLGTDVGGGYSSSMLNAMRHSLIASFSREALYEGGSGSGLTLEEVFHMATLGGAQVAGLEDQIGSFEVGKSFDALIIDMRDERKGVNAPMEDQDNPRTVLEKFIMTGDDRNISEVFVRGHSVHTA